METGFRSFFDQIIHGKFTHAAPAIIAIHIHGKFRYARVTFPRAIWKCRSEPENFTGFANHNYGMFAVHPFADVFRGAFARFERGDALRDAAHLVCDRHLEVEHGLDRPTQDLDVAILDSVVRAAANEGIRAAGIPLISRTRIHNNGQMGIRIDGLGGAVIGNVVAGNGDLGIRAQDAVFADNMLSQNQLGLYFLGGDASVVRGNAFSNSPLVDVASTKNSLVVDNAIHGIINAGSETGTNGNVLGDNGSSSISGGAAIAPNVCDGALGCP